MKTYTVKSVTINGFINLWLLKVKIKKNKKARTCFACITEYLFLNIALLVYQKKKVENVLFLQMLICF